MPVHGKPNVYGRPREKAKSKVRIKRNRFTGERRSETKKETMIIKKL